MVILLYSVNLMTYADRFSEVKSVADISYPIKNISAAPATVGHCHWEMVAQPGTTLTSMQMWPWD